jgi:hypothetical protein
MQNPASARNAIRTVDTLYPTDYNNQGTVLEGVNPEPRFGVVAEIG